MGDPEDTEMTDIQYGKGGHLAEALAKAQGEINNPKKGSANPYFKSRYADLADGINAIREALSKHGIAYIQTTRIDSGLLVLTSYLVHERSGESIEAEWPVGDFKTMTPQEMGSALTYARRYTLFPMVGIAGDDDDSNAASRRTGNGQKAATAASAERYQDEWEQYVREEEDPKALRDKWIAEAETRKDLLSEIARTALHKLVTERIDELKKAKPQ